MSQVEKAIFFKPEVDRPFPFNREGRKTRVTINMRHTAGESIKSIADDYNLSLDEVKAIVEKTPF